MKELIGTGVALITPFKENLEVDVEALRGLVNNLVENNIDYLVVLGTTAESVTLSKSEKELVISTVIDANRGRVPLVLGIGGNNTKKVVHELNTRDLSSFCAILSVSPMYNKPSQEGIYQHFAAIAESTSKPIILYNVPGRTASNILPKTVIRLAKGFKNIVGIKEAAGDIVQAMRLISGCPKNFLVISGDDMITLPMILAGGKGVISVIAEGFPKEFSKMVQLGLNKDVNAAYQIHYKLAPAIDYIFEEGNPAGIKAVLSKKGICEDTVRLPLVKVSDALSVKINSFIDDF